jgi:hypothetical protein
VSATTRKICAPLRTGCLDLDFYFGGSHGWDVERGEFVRRLEELFHPTATDFGTQQLLDGLRSEEIARLGFSGKILG